MELKPCPFCGCVDIRKITTLTHTQIYCSDCMCGVTRGMLLGKCDTLAEAEEEFGFKATEAWNRRATEIVKVETNFYDKEEIHENCTVQVLTNTKTGEVSVGWWKNED